MSTFNGIVHEFPDIAVDYFHPHASGPPPLACFLSHVHSDHLQGLDTLKSPFVYCSAATREMLLRLETRSSRLAYANGQVEAPVRTYSHLKTLLKPIPLETPTMLELEPENYMQVTLFDANHCPGAVMFLFEGRGKAVIYTGDIRSEPWWVNSIARNPSLVEYSSGIKTLDRIYLDTSMLSDYVLESKADGLRMLLSKVAAYPQDTIFCMQAWTYGYEEVWIALSKALGCQIHVDRYKLGVYRSLLARTSSDQSTSQTHHSKEAPYLVGFYCGNQRHDGCLTRDEKARIHSCEKGTSCSAMQGKPIVWIRPVVAQLDDGQEITEIGLGGGGDDFEQDIALAELRAEEFQRLLQMISESEDLSAIVKEKMKQLVLTLSGQDSDLCPYDDDLLFDLEDDLSSVIWPMVRSLRLEAAQSLPDRITFPYARHSSLPELRHLVETFKPRDIWPCTVDLNLWEERGITMRKLFGASCSSDVFEHDESMQRMAEAQALVPENEGDWDTQRSANSTHLPSSPVQFRVPIPQIPSSASKNVVIATSNISTLLSEIDKSVADVEVVSVASSSSLGDDDSNNDGVLPRKRNYVDFEGQNDSQASVLSARTYETRRRAFEAATLLVNNEDHYPITLLSTTDHHSELEEELGQPQSRAP